MYYNIARFQLLNCSIEFQAKIFFEILIIRCYRKSSLIDYVADLICEGDKPKYNACSYFMRILKR